MLQSLKLELDRSSGSFGGNWLGFGLGLSGSVGSRTQGADCLYRSGSSGCRTPASDLLVSVGFGRLQDPRGGLPGSLRFVWFQDPSVGSPCFGRVRSVPGFSGRSAGSLGFVWLQEPRVGLPMALGSFGGSSVGPLGRSGSFGAAGAHRVPAAWRKIVGCAAEAGTSSRARLALRPTFRVLMGDGRVAPGPGTSYHE
jgi:hypothetical protein